MTALRFAPEVPGELAEAALWYEGKRAGLGDEFLGEIEGVLPVIASRPRSFPQLTVKLGFEIVVRSSRGSHTRWCSSFATKNCVSWRWRMRSGGRTTG